MKVKRLVIDGCRQCPYFDNESYSYASECTALNRFINTGENYEFITPDDCPLEEIEIQGIEGPEDWQDVDNYNLLAKNNK